MANETKQIEINKNHSNQDENSGRTREEHKRLEETYNEYIDENLPGDHHRGDITSSNRMLAYSDAVMATCATFLVLPIRNLKVLMKNTPINNAKFLNTTTHSLTTLYINITNTKNKTLSDFIESFSNEFVMFFIGFLIVLTIWENMNLRAIVIKRVDDFILTLVIFEMLATTVLPFTLALQGHYPYEKVSVLSTCVVLGILQIIDIGIVLYATLSPKLLHVDLKNWSKNDLRELSLIMIFRPLISLILLITAGLFCLVHFAVSWVFIALLIVMPTVRKAYWFVRRRMKSFNEGKKESFLEHFSKGNISKERIEIMSDAAVAIVACILILDITVEEFPEPDKLNGHSLTYTLNHMKTEFLTFLGTFCLVSALWYVNHAVIHLIRTVSSIMWYFQKIFLSFCCLCPLAGNMVSNFATKGNNESKIAIRFSAMIVFISSSANLIIILYGLLTGSKYLHEWASFEHFQKNKRQHIYILTKALILPFWSLICTLGSLGSPFAAPYVLYVTYLAAPCSFFVSKFILMNHVGKTTAYLRKTIIRLSTHSNNKKPEFVYTENNLFHATNKIENSLETRHLDSYVIRNENINDQ
ncbi:endosomal/lysosomal proton channel TMEM175-like [Hydra vulgaris]|uniref:endosomal/lysosomal proton channel TMEM175-like n=1 Tax=Hydra vulgaris TaxID=6087 RepID=UPI0032E9F528